MIDKALMELRPDAKWTLTGSTLSGLVWHDASSTRPTDAEINAKVTELEAAEPLRLLRVERNRKIAETDWWASSDLTMTDAQKKYRQDLRDITKTATSLDDVKWPEKP
jgi:hypothetical protein